MSVQIIGALAKLDKNNDDHWTADGLPRLDVLKDFGATDASRVDVTNAAKGFSRNTTHVLDALLAPANVVNAEAQDQDNRPEDGAEDKVEAQSVEEAAAELDAANADLQFATEAVNEAQAKFEAARAELAQATVLYDRAVLVVEREGKESAEARRAADIAAYQRSQHELRMQGSEI